MQPTQQPPTTKPQPTPVYLNIYNFSSCYNTLCGCLGLGMYHTAIEILQVRINKDSDVEFMFHGWAGDNTGVAEVVAKSAPYPFEKQVLLGQIEYGYWDMYFDIIQPLRNKYRSNTYDLLNNNCNHFSYQLAQNLGLSASHPNSYIFRLTNFCNFFRCLIPTCILSGRLDWFRNRQQQKQQLEQIHVNSSIDNYEELKEDGDERQIDGQR